VRRSRSAPSVALSVALLCTAAQSSAAAGSHAAPATSQAAALPAKVRAMEAAVASLEAKVELMELSARRYANWRTCLRGVPVSEYGDPDRQFGYVYDELDGTARGHRPALAVDRKSRPRREDYLFLNFRRGGDCRTNAPLPGGTADPASASGRSLPDTLTTLERRVKAMKRSARRLLAASERFDQWESCVSQVPVTEYGDPDRKFGYLFGAPGGVFGYRPALAIDRSDWDDPEYFFLALVGGDRPGRRCQDEPGEAPD
jgi:hypothetical protein